MLKYVLSEQRPAYAVELCEAECGAQCAVVTRDYDVAKAAERCAVLIFQGGRLYRARKKGGSRKLNKGFKTP